MASWDRSATSRVTVTAVLLAVAAWLTILPPLAAREPTSPLALIMVDDPNCSYCRKFDAEVGPGYPRSREGRVAPLVKLRRGSFELAALDLSPTNYTPTFILMRGKREIGRITGYPGAEFFYEELDSLLERAGSTFWLAPVAPGTAGARTVSP